MPYRTIDWTYGVIVLAFLNNNWPEGRKPKRAPASRKRITTLVESLRAVQDVAIESATNYEDSVFANRQQAIKMHQSVARVNELLKPFVLSPSVPLTNFWQPQEDDPAKVKIAYNIDRALGSWKGVPQKEFEAVQAIFRLVRKGNLERLKRCRCGMWWYADRKDQRGCSPFCRSKDYRDNEDYRRVRRELQAKRREKEPSRLATKRTKSIKEARNAKG